MYMLMLTCGYVYVDMWLMIPSPLFPGAARPCRQQHCDHVGGEQE